MKICILSWWAQKLFDAQEPQPFGGAELQLVLLARQFAQRGAEVRFITRGQGPARSFDIDGIQVHKIAVASNPYVRKVQTVRDTLAALQSHPADVYLQRGGGIETGLVGFAAWRTNTPFVFMTSHRWDVDGTHATRRGWLFGQAFRFGLRQTSAIITQSEEQLHALYETTGRSGTVLRSGHEIPPSLPGEKRGVLFISRCEPWKNPHAMLDMARALDGVPVTMVCPPANDAALFEDIRSAAATIPHLRFLDGIPFEETEALFATHRVFVNTSDSEGVPNTFVQACKWGTPIVSLRVDPDGMLNQRGAGLCTDGDIHRAVTGIREFLFHDERWGQASESARAYATQNHDIRDVAGRVYDILLGAGTASPTV